jgi:post-segregation antitoxin (ccd killing protein)
MAINEHAKTHVSAQVQVALREELLRRARAADRSLSAEIRRALTAHIARDDEEEA